MMEHMSVHSCMQENNENGKTGCVVKIQLEEENILLYAMIMSDLKWKEQDSVFVCMFIRTV